MFLTHGFHFWIHSDYSPQHFTDNEKEAIIWEKYTSYFKGKIQKWHTSFQFTSYWWGLNHWFHITARKDRKSSSFLDSHMLS